MDFYMAPAGNSSRSSLQGYYEQNSAAAARGSQFRQQSRKDKQQQSVTFQVHSEVFYQKFEV